MELVAENIKYAALPWLCILSKLQIKCIENNNQNGIKTAEQKVLITKTNSYSVQSAGMGSRYNHSMIQTVYLCKFSFKF